MRPAENGDGSLRPEEVAQGIRGMGCLGEGADEDQVDLGRQFFEQIFKTGVTDESNVVAFVFCTRRR